MKKLLKIYWAVAVLMFVGTLLSGGCSDSDKEVAETPESEPGFVTVLLDDSYILDYAGEMRIRGLHFAEGDRVFFKQGDRQAAIGDDEFPVTIERLAQTDITVRITPDIVSGEWSVFCRRGAETQYLGTTILDVDIFRLVKNVVVDAAYMLDKGDIMALSGEGFTSGDQVVFSRNDGSAEYAAAVSSVTGAGITFNIVPGIVSGDWDIICRRGNDSQLLGTTSLTVSAFPFIDPAELPEGTNAYGRVYCGAEPLAGVYVSDGAEVVETDAQGVYTMKSARYDGTLFVSLPSGYEAPAENGIPQFYALFEEGRDRYDFALSEAVQDNYVLLVTADIQVDNATRRMVPQSSLQSCKESFVPAFSQAVSELVGRKVYSVSLGDMVYDKYWYSNRFGIPEYKELIGQFGVPTFHIMGNHDNDPYCADDYLAEQVYKEELGPTYYSLNIGKVHYVALDNIVYINTGASPGITGSTNYGVSLTERQKTWLQKDLATVDPSTPVIVWMHAPLTNCRVFTPTVNPGFSGASTLASYFDGFSKVLVLSGHWHNNHTAVYPGKPHITEHNLGSVCGSIWYNVKGFNGENQPFGSATDGTPVGFGVYEIDGTDIRWKYRPCDAAPDVQFTAYDMNKTPYKDKTVANEILVNVWGWDQAWNVEILESGNPLTVTRQMRQDPNYLRYIEDVYKPSGDSMDKGAAKAQTTPHMFSAVTASAGSPVLVRVTDRFGEVYTQQLRD